MLGLGNGFQSVPHFPCRVIYPCSVLLKFSQSYFCKITEGNRVAAKLPSAYLNLQPLLLSGSDRRPELISQIPNLAWQQVGMKNIFRVGSRYLSGWEIIQWDIISRKHLLIMVEFWSGMYFFKRKVKMRKEQKWNVFSINSMLWLPTYEDSCHLFSKLIAPVLNSALCSCMFELPHASLSQ